MSDDRIFQDSEIHAFVDLELDQARATELMQAMSIDPVLRKRVDDYSRINLELQHLLNPTMTEPVPERFTEAIEHLRKKAEHKPHEWRPLMRAAVVAGLMLLSGGGGVGWGLYSQGEQRSSVALVNQNLVEPATFAHAVFSPDEVRPVEINGEHEAQLSTWLSKRMKTQIEAPDLTSLGFELLGGRLLPSTNRMAAQFMYEDGSGSRVTLYIRRLELEGVSDGFQYAGSNGVGAYYWIDEGFGYALSGDEGTLDKEFLLTLSKFIRQSTCGENNNLIAGLSPSFFKTY